MSKTKTICIVLLLVFTSAAASSFNKPTFISIITSYLPFNIFSSFYELTFQYNLAVQKLRNKIDLTKDNSFNLNLKSKEPLIVVMIIGESMRGDLISLNGYKYHDNVPLISKRKNIISFSNSISSSTSTRISLPYMLTRALPPNFNQALSELSIISIFKHLGFETSWLGNQGIFGVYETTFAPIVMEADFKLTKTDLRKAFPHTKIYDEHILSFLDKRMTEVKSNHFIVVHLLGSHWNFDQRYPKSFNARFKPICNSSSPEQCSKEQLLNSYSNSILYTDYILDRILTQLEGKNSLVIYASDHGISLGENAYIGNAYNGENIPKEQLNIAMFMWGSDRFLELYSEKYQKIEQKKAANISHSYIFHSLLDCIGVKSNIINKNLSVCH